jgi:metal-sulfur cluster biosynthetic enzyme
MIMKEQVYEKLKKVMDPELFIDIVSLGLIYDVGIQPAANGIQQIRVIMTLTTPGCPLAPVIDQLVREAIKPLGDYEIVLDLVWEPAWTKDRMSDEAKLQLGVI